MWLSLVILELITEKLCVRTFILPGPKHLSGPGTMYLLHLPLLGPD